MNSLVEKIREIVSDKELSFGCVVTARVNWSCTYTSEIVCITKECVYLRWQYGHLAPYVFKKNRIEKIIWKKIYLWDMVQYLNWIVSDNTENEDYTEEIEAIEKDLLQHWWKYAWELWEQDDECILFIRKTICNYTMK